MKTLAATASTLRSVQRRHRLRQRPGRSRTTVSGPVTFPHCPRPAPRNHQRPERTAQTIEAQLDAAVAVARSEGLSWDKIGRAYGVTRQGARKRWDAEKTGSSGDARAPAHYGLLMQESADSANDRQVLGVCTL